MVEADVLEIPQEEAGAGGKIMYALIVSRHMMKLNEQILKLPHENMIPGVNSPNGTTYDDIVRSFIDGVDVLESVLKPYRTKDYDKLVFTADIEGAKKKLAALYDLCDYQDMLLDRTVAVIATSPDESGVRIDDTEAAPETK